MPIFSWFKTAPNGPQRCKIMLNSGPKEVKNGPRFKNSQNSITDLLKGRIIGAFHGKRAFEPKNSILARFLGSNGYFFTYNVHLFWCEKSCKESIERKKSGCHPWKNGHLTPKMVKIGQNSWWWAIIPSRMVKNNLGQPLIYCEMI